MIFCHFDSYERFQVSFIRTKIGKIGPNLLIRFICTKMRGNIVNLMTIDDDTNTAHHGRPTKLLVCTIRSLIATMAGSMG